MNEDNKSFRELRDQFDSGIRIFTIYRNDIDGLIETVSHHDSLLNSLYEHLSKILMVQKEYNRTLREVKKKLYFLELRNNK